MSIRLPDIRPRAHAWGQLIRIGFPLAAGQGIAALGFTVLQGVVNGFGVAVIAAFGVGNRIIGMFNMPAGGLARAVGTLVSQELGSGNEEGAKDAVRLGVISMLCFIVPSMVVTFFFGNHVVRFFIDDPEVIAHGATLFRVVSISVVFFTLFTVVTGAFQGGGDTKPVMYLNIFRLWGVRVPLAMYLSWQLGWEPHGVWWAMVASNVLTASVGFALLRGGRWLRRIELIEPTP